MDKTQVVHCKKDSYDVYIGRGSKWGNPYIIGRDGRRGDVIDEYRCHLLRSPELIIALPELYQKVLGCFCKPLPCHGDILAELVDRCMTALSSREREVLCLWSGNTTKDGEPYPSQAVATVIGTTRAEARRIEVKAMRKLWHKAEAILISGATKSE